MCIIFVLINLKRRQCYKKCLAVAVAQTSTAKVCACNGTIIEGFFCLSTIVFCPQCTSNGDVMMCMGAHVLRANLTLPCVKISSQSSVAPVFLIMFLLNLCWGSRTLPRKATCTKKEHQLCQNLSCTKRLQPFAF